jgi:hypothetical protein
VSAPRFNLVQSRELMRRGAGWSWYIPVSLPQRSIGEYITVDGDLLVFGQIKILPEVDEVALGLQNQ